MREESENKSTTIESAPLENSETVPAEKAEGSARTVKKPRPTKALPTDRLPLTRQLEVLRGYVAASSYGEKAVPNRAVASVVGLSESSVSSVNSFLLENGLLVRGEGGNTPTPEAVAFGRAAEFDPLTAPKQLASVLGRQWAAQLLLPRLAIRPLEESEALQALAIESGSSQDTRPQLKLILELLTLTGLLQRDGSQYRLGTNRDLPEERPKETAVEAPNGRRVEDGSQATVAVPRGFIVHAFQLRRDLMIKIPLPPDFSAADVKRMYQWLKILPWEADADGAEKGEQS